MAVLEFAPRPCPELSDEEICSVGWRVIQDIKADDGDLLFQLGMFLEDDELRISEDLFLERARNMGKAAGLAHAKKLWSQQERIPKEWRDLYLLFPGTLVSLPRNIVCMICMEWCRDKWQLGLYWTEREFDSGERLVLVCK